MASGGFRSGTLLKLKYRQVKNDLEAGIVPVHIHVEAEIIKGKYCNYDTFIGSEAVEYLKVYLETRRRPKESHKRLCLKVTLIEKGNPRYDLRVHSLRKYFWRCWNQSFHNR